MRRHTKCIILCIISACLAVAGNAFEYESIIEKIPEKDRFDFVKHHIQLGYDLSRGKATRSKLRDALELPTEFSIGLYTYARNGHQIYNPELLRQLREIICFEDGTCIDVGDIGVHPYNY